jgi:dTDP-4-amino-4,6-dideoxygalactose transaminase
MAEYDVATNVHYKPLPMHTAYKSLGFRIEDFPNAFAQYQNEITMPLHTLMDEEQIDYVCSSYSKAIRTI